MNIGRERIYNSAFRERGQDDVVLWDVMHVKHGEKVKVIFESFVSPWRQGVWLRTDKGLIVNHRLCPSVALWIDTAPPEVLCECQTEDGFLSVYNIWDSRRGLGVESQMWSSGMLIDELPLGRRYRCNDIGFETKFDKLLFRIERLPS